MRVKEIDRTANIAWSPAEQHPIYIAAGTAAQQLDATFSTSAALEIYPFNLAEPGLELEPIGSIASDFRFHKLCWGAHGIGRTEESSGLLVGGTDNGKVFIWDPTAIIKGEEALVHRLEKHNGAVAALDFNPFQSNLLATGASESEIYIWDLNKPQSPMTPGQKSQPPDDVTCVSWNRQVQHILASTYAGRCVVWDLRKNEPIIKVSDSMSRIKCKLVAWHPEVATQMCLSSEDDHSPVIQLWDLRFATSPLKILENHQRGILSIAWCPQDPDLLLSCGKDNRILCWNPNSQAQMGEHIKEVIYELPTSNQWSFDVQWCPRNPSVISSCSFDGHIGVYSLMGGSQPPAAPTSKIADSFPTDPFAPQAPQQSSQQEAQPVVLKKPPKWIRRPVGATFGFGGKLITFENVKTATNPQQPQTTAPRQVHISQVVTETDLVTRSTQLESALNNAQYAEFCSLKVANSKNDLEENVWNFLKVHFEKDPRTRYLDLLGYDQSEIAKKVADMTGESVSAAAGDVDAADLAQRVATLDTTQTASDQELSGNSSMDGTEAFEKISRTELEQAAKNESLPFLVDDDCDGLVTKAILTANFEAAVEVCLHNDRMAEAMILAMAGGPELMMQTQKKFFQKQQDNLSRLISAVVTRDYEQIVRTCDLQFWKEALAISLTYAKSQQFASLCDILGSRLEAEQDPRLSSNAVLCYICAGNVAKLVECWSRIIDNSTSPVNLQDLVEKVMILRKAIETTSGVQAEVSSALLAQKLVSYSELLAAQGSLSTAVNYLGSSTQTSIAILRDRLYQSLPEYQGAALAKPFNQVNVQPEGMAKPTQQPAQQAPHDRQKTSSGYYQASGTFSTTTTPTYTGYNYSRGQGSMLGQQTVQPTGYPNYDTSYSATSNTAPTAVSKGPLAHKYPSPTQPTSTGYDQYNPPTMFNPNATSYTGYSGNAYTGSPGSGHQPNTSMAQPIANSQHSHTPGAPQSTAQPLPANLPSYQDTPAPQPGWNDPPPLKSKQSSSGSATSTAPSSVPAPITRPIYGQPEQGPPGAPTYVGQTQVYNPQQYQQEQQQQQQAVQQAAVKAEPPKPKEKGPIPAEHQALQQVFDKLANQCLAQSNNPHIKRKLEDVLRKLEALYDKLRDNLLSQNVTVGLHQIIQAIMAYDYQTALGYHQQMVSQANFSEISSFMPGIKMLMQTAMQMNVFVQLQQ